MVYFVALHFFSYYQLVEEITNSVEIKKEANNEITTENEEFYKEYDDKSIENDIELIQKLIN